MDNGINYDAYAEIFKAGHAAIVDWYCYADGSQRIDWLDREGDRLAAWAAAHPIERVGRTPSAQFTLAELRAWKVDRTSGFLKVVRKARPMTPAKRLTLVLRAVEAHGTPELLARVRALAA